MRNELSQNEKIARMISKPDSGAIYTNVSDKTLDQQIENYHREKWNESVQEIENRFAGHEQRLQEAADEFAKKLDGVQIMPICNYVIAKPYTENPFQKVKIDKSSGLILSTGGLAPVVKRDDSGEYVEEEQMVKVGVVVEVGPECKYAKRGDTIMWTKMSEVVIPFYDFGFRLVNETRALVIINDDLKERFNLE